MKKYLYIIFLFFSNLCLGQINLVSNPSFEMIYSCPNDYYQIDSAIGWGTLKNGGGGSPDLFHICCTSPTVCGVPQNTFDLSFQYPHSGNAYCDIQVVGSLPGDYREYIQSKLKKGLSAGHTYCVKFYSNLTDNSLAYIKPLGAYFDDGSISAPPPFGLAVATPQVYNTVQPLNDSINWMKVEGAFTATGLETYISLGNFFSSSNSDIVLIGTPSFWFSFYYIDDVSVIDAALLAYAGEDTLIHPGDSVFIGRQPEIGLDEDCIWFVNGQPIDTIAGLWVQPDSSTTYILEQTICGNVSWDTVTVSVYGTGIGAYTKDGKGIKIYPSPATNTLSIENTTKFSQLLISDVLGNVRISQQVFNQALTIDISRLTKGLYFIKLTTDDGIIVKKFLKE